MAWPPVAADLYVHGAPESYFTTTPAISADTISAAIQRALGKLSRLVGPRAGGPAASWTWTDSAGQEDATGDVVTVAAAALALAHGLVLPGEGADPQWAKKAEAIEALWSRMGTPGVRPAEPLYSGLTDATPSTTEGAPRGWSVALLYAETEATA